MIPVLFAVLLSAADPRPTVAIVPPSGGDAWLGYAVADNLTNRLLIHSRFEPGSLERVYPLNVLGWRQVLSAARAEGVDTQNLHSKELGRLQKQLGADWIITGEIGRAGAGFGLHWKLWHGATPTGGQLPLAPDDLAQAGEQLSAAVLKALGENPGSVGGHRLAKLPLAAMKPYGEALCILGAQSLDPRAHLVLSAAQIERAHALLTTATQAAPTFVRAWVERGITSAMAGQYGRAEEELVQAMAQAGEFEPATALGLYYLYDRQHKETDALAVLKEATDTHLGFLHGLGYLGEAYARAGKVHESLQVFTQYIARAPHNLWAQVRHAAALSRIGKYEQALQAMQKLVAANPDSLLLKSALALRQIDAGKLSLARATLKRALARYGEQPTLLTHMASLELVANHPQAAFELAERAVAKLGDGRGEPLAGYAHLNLGHALALLGKKDEALAALAKAKQLGLEAEDVRQLTRDPRLAELLQDPRCPIFVGHQHPGGSKP